MKREENQRACLRRLRLLRQEIRKAQGMETLLLRILRKQKLDRATSSRKNFHYGWSMQDLEDIGLPTFSFGNPNWCVYCGDPANSRDHIIPVSFQSSSKKRKFHGCGPWCWACMDCNSHLSNRYFDSFKTRCEWAKWRIEKKAEPITWSGNQVAGLDYTLRTSVLANVKKLKWLRQRADFYQSREFFLNIESLIWQVREVSCHGNGGRYLAAYFSSILNDIAYIYKPYK